MRKAIICTACGAPVGADKPYVQAGSPIARPYHFRCWADGLPAEDRARVEAAVGARLEELDRDLRRAKT